jgi:hypothetical protein
VGSFFIKKIKNLNNKIKIEIKGKKTISYKFKRYVVSKKKLHASEKNLLPKTYNLMKQAYKLAYLCY